MLFLLSVVVFSCVTLTVLWLASFANSQRRPGWFDNEWVAMFVGVGLTGGLAFSFAFLFKASLLLPLPLWGDIATATGTAAIVWAISWLVARSIGQRRVQPRP